MSADDQQCGNSTDPGQRRHPVHVGDPLESALGGSFLGQGHPTCFRRGLPPLCRRAASGGRYGRRSISTPEIRVCASFLSVARGSFAGNSTSEKSGPIRI
ncbi:Uncharacterised protein [Mycobacterium tuberculosis]|nr:Uncharacterised protein [Mycobacterium tuberculosis]